MKTAQETSTGGEIQSAPHTTKDREGPFRAYGDKVRDKVTRGKTKEDSIFFRDSLKKSFDILPAPSIFHFIGSNDASDKNQNKNHIERKT